MLGDLYLRITAPQDRVEAFRNLLLELPAVVRAEQVADLRGEARDDSSSAGLPDDVGPGAHFVEIGLDDKGAAPKVRRAVMHLAGTQGLAVEVIDERR